MRTVGLLLLPDSRAFDVAVAAEVWGIDRTGSGIGPFTLRVCAPGRVPGRADPHAPVPDEVVRALRGHAGSVAALCSGAFTLAAAGLLDGRAATTHWRLIDDLVAAAPRAEVRRDVLFTTDGPVHTSAGVVGGVDLCLHLVRRDHGADVAAALARRLVMPPAREGGQRQYAEPTVPARPDQVGMAATVDWAVTRIGDPIGVGDLADHARMSGRTFHRTFVAATGLPPGRWLAAQRMLLARRLLETTDLPVHRVAEHAGLGTAANLRRRLRDAVGVSPDAYRRTFGRARQDGGRAAPA